MRYLLLAAILVILASSAFAQFTPLDKCRIKVLVVKQDWESGTLKPETFSVNQDAWWQKHRKHFPGLCLVTNTPADYVLAWTENWTTVTATINAPVTSTSSGTVTTSDGRTATYSGTTITNQPQQREFNHWWVDARIFKLDGDKPQTPELFLTRHHGRWLWSKPDMDAFQDAIKHVAKVSRSK